MTNTYVKIEKDLSKFEDRVNEIDSNVTAEQVKHAVSLCKRALYQERNSIGICAPQVGENIRLFVIKTNGSYGDKFKVFLNPMIVASEGLHLSRETNLSFPDKEFIIPRQDKVHVAYQELLGEVNSETFTGAFGEIVQQMIQMLDGITLADYGLDLDDIGGVAAFNKAKKTDKEKVLQMYLDSLKEISADFAKEIDSNPDLKRVNDVIEFNTKMLNGEIKPLDENGNPVEFKTEEQAMEEALAKVDKALQEKKLNKYES